MRVAVIGAGIVGTCAAFALARERCDVTVFEQFEVDHDRGSSFGDSRIIRRFYDDPYYTRLMERSYPAWRRLEEASGEKLVVRSGGLYFATRRHPSIATAAAALQTPIQNAEEMRRLFPQFVFAQDEIGVVDEEAGILRASLCVRAAASCARAAGARMLTGKRILTIEPEHGGVRLVTVDGERLRFERAIVCAGPWSLKLLKALELPLRVTRQQYVHVRPTSKPDDFKLGEFPVWIDAARLWYGFPQCGDVEGVKLACHKFGESIDPDAPDRAPDDAAIARTRDYARSRLPALADGEISYAKVCLYTVTPDEDFIVDAVPGIPGCHFIAGLSGHGFKFGALLGEIAADLAHGRDPGVDLSRFPLARFATSNAERP